MAQYTNKRVISELNQFIKKINRTYKIERAILFGSRSRNDWLYTSDVDVMIISKLFKNIPFTERMSKTLHFWKLPLDLEVICYTPEEFEQKRKQIGIVQQAVQEGKELAII